MLRLLPFLLLSSISTFAQRPSKTPTKPSSPISKRPPSKPIKESFSQPYDSLFKSLNWRNIGPYRGGRSNAVTGIPGKPNTYLVGYTGGGIWKTEDAGISWKNISDNQLNTSTIGDIAVSHSNPNIIYAGTGEHAIRGVMTSFGDGIYKSYDGGNTWHHTGLSQTRHISDVIIHPSNPDIVYVAAQGALHGNNPERGIFKTTDGGITWNKILYINDSTGISSLSMDPSNPRTLYAASWQHRRTPWKVISGGEGCSLWKSEDAGESWKKINSGLPKSLGKMGISVSPANPSRIYAIVEAEKSKAGVYRSDNGGKSWQHLSNNQDLTARSWYYMEIFTDPANENQLYVLNAPMMKSIDGGKTWSNIRVGHGDTHDLWINPNDPKNMILGDDGGAEITFNGGQTWSSLNNQPTGQFYRVNTDNLFPYKIYGGQQDNTSVIISSRTNGPGITEREWTAGAGCESAFQAFDPNDPTMVFGGCYQGYIEVLNTKTREGKDVQAYPSLNLAVEPRRMTYRFNWNAPIITSPHDPKTIYHGANVLLRTQNGGMDWEVISPDLTRNDSTKQGPGGGPITNEGAGGENYNTLAYVIESPLEKGVIWTGSDCGLVHVSRDNGKSWQNVTPPDLAECLINSIEVSPHDKGLAYISATRYKFNDFAPYAYKTFDYGKTWFPINNGIQADDFLRVIREDRKRKGWLYGGAERGFYVSDNGGASWQQMQRNLPNVPVTDLTFQDNDLVASTAGRGFWILDDLGAIQQYQGAQLPTIFLPKPAYKYGGGPLPGESDPYAGTTAPGGVIFDYYLPEKPDTALLKMEIFDNKGRLIRSYTNRKDESYKRYPGGPPPKAMLSAAKGMNRFLWDLRGEQVADIEGVFILGDYRGHLQPPGQYTARLSISGQISEAVIKVLPDPQLTVDQTAWQEQQQFLERIATDIEDMHRMVNLSRKARKQLENIMEKISKDTSLSALRISADTLANQLKRWEKNIAEDRITNGQDVINWPSGLNAEFFNIRGMANAHDPRITSGLKKRLNDLESLWSGYKQHFEGDLKKAIEQFNQQYRQVQLPAILLQ